ncbi:MAG: hypothetical protein HYZ83_04950 [Candidatus Omnitrophica bacterium]|nr:hypothetical protein [Candidatus Omnitrophota bacterium]
MENKKSKFCPAMWFSGFFGLGAVMHLIRLLGGFSVVIAGREIPLGLSGVAVLVFGILSVGLLLISLKKPCEMKKDSGSACCK